MTSIPSFNPNQADSGTAMRSIVCLASYGTKNETYLHHILTEYRRMPFEIDVVVVSDRPRQLGADVEVKVGTPLRNPHSLPFAHKSILADRIDHYDLFIYSEDDILITERNISAFIEQTKIVPKQCIPGFIRYEMDAYGKKYFPDFFSRFHWVIDSVEVHGGETFARFGNDHSGAYMMTKNQLRTALDSGGYMVPPHIGGYDLECSAATDPYTQCGFSRVICISRLEDILIHHMPNVYIGRKGINFKELHCQIESLLDFSFREDSLSTLFPPHKKIGVRYWDKEFYEESDPQIVHMLKGPNKRVLSIGAGWGKLEEQVKMLGHFVKAIPVDSVIAASLAHRGIEAEEPSFEKALKQSGASKFDCIILSNVLQHLESPDRLIDQLVDFIEPHGCIIAKIPNFNFVRWKSSRPETYSDSLLSCIGVDWLRKKMIKHGFKVLVKARGSERADCFFRLFGPLFANRIARFFLVVASK